MAVENIDLSGEIKAWKDAVYGKEVRAANVAALGKIQGAVNETVQNVNQASEDASNASQNAQKAVDDIQSAIKETTDKASEAAKSASVAAESKQQAASSATAAESSKEQAAESAEQARKIAEGFGAFDGTAATVKATDTYGLVVDALGESTAQALIDAIANKVMNELISKSKIVNNLLATDPTTVLAGTQGKALGERLTAAEKAVTQLNGDSLKNIRFTIDPGTQIIKCGYPAFAFILTVQGTRGAAYGSYIINGYGDGGTQRYHIGAIQKGDAVDLSVGSEGSQTLILTNNTADLTLVCSAVMLMGNSVTI